MDVELWPISRANQKPVELLETLIHNTPFATNVADPFAGSGTTLIACETTRRTFFGIELDPLYVDVICKRYHEFTGQQAILEATGQTFEEVQDVRYNAAENSKESYSVGIEALRIKHETEKAAKHEADSVSSGQHKEGSSKRGRKAA